MAMEAVINHALMGILREFLNRCELKWKRFKHAASAVAYSGGGWRKLKLPQDLTDEKPVTM